MQVEEREHRIKPSCPQYDVITSRKQVNLFLSGQGGGKCLGKGTMVRMYDGSKKAVENIVVGDKLLGPDSKPRLVLSIASGREQMYWIRQNRAVDYRVNESHILVLRQSRSREGKNREDEISVAEYLQKNKRYKNSMMGFRVAVDYEKKHLPIDPYFFGIWLGDGSERHPHITNVDSEIIDYINEFACKNNLYVRKNCRSSNSVTYCLTKGRSQKKENNVLSDLKKLGVIKNKHIPNDYMCSSKEDRLLLLAGLIDTDGSYCKRKNGYEITQKRRELAENIYELCLSLGFRASIKQRRAILKRHGKEDYECAVWRVSFYGNFSDVPVKVNRKIPNKVSGRIDYRNTGIKVEKDTIDDYYGFMIDGDGRFLLEDFTVTHNTFIAGVVSGLLITNFPKVRGFIGANTYNQLSDSTLQRIRTVWADDFGWTEWSKDNLKGNYVVDVQPPAHFNTEGHQFDTYRGKICFEDGTVIFKGSLENYKSHDGKEFGWAILDETKDTKEEAVKEVILGRLRQGGMYINKDDELVDSANSNGLSNTAWNPLFIFTSPAKVKWINEWFNLDDYIQEITKTIYSEETYFVKDLENKKVVICSTYHNAKNLPGNYISNQKANLPVHLQDMLIYGNPFTSSGGEFYKCFNRIRNVIDVTAIDGYNNNGRAYNANLPLHLSFDFNVNPYMTCTVWQIEKIRDKNGIETGEKNVYQIDEICLSNPLNTTNDVCKEIIRRYQGHDKGMFIYGDPSGKKQDTRSEKGHNDYVVVIRALYIFKPSLRISSAAPSVVMRGNFINTIFEKGYEGVRIFVHNKCVNSINDYVYLKEDSDGTKKKERVQNENTKVAYEKYGHTSDSGDYFLCVAFASEFARYQKGGVSSSAPSTGKKKPGRNSY